MAPEVGADVESVCKKCGDVWHVIVAKVEDKIAKVQCKECNATHRYKPKTAAKKKKPAAKRKTAKKTEPPAEVPLVEPDPSRPVKSYLASGTYERADQVNHPTFGVGVVEEVLHGKVQVWFPDGRKVLASAKPESLLPAGGRARPLSNDS